MSWQLELMNQRPLRHKPSGDIISPESVTAHQGGALVSTDGGWRFYPAAELEPVTPLSGSDPYEACAMPIRPQTDTETIAAYSYFFGLDQFQAELRSGENVACMVIPDLGLLRCSKLELEASDHAPAGTAIEYSFIESGIEYPVLPVDEEQVTDERLFPGLPLRFGASLTAPIVIKKDGEISGLDLAAAISKKDAVYTASYRPVTGFHHVPEGTSIGLKIILRRHSPQAMSPWISSLLIRQWGMIQ